MNIIFVLFLSNYAGRRKKKVTAVRHFNSPFIVRKANTTSNAAVAAAFNKLVN